MSLREASPYRAPQHLSAREAELIAFLDTGEQLVKHGRNGPPKPKWVHIAKVRRRRG